MKRPAFLDATSAEVSAWATLPMTAAFFEWMDWEAEELKDEIADCVFSGKSDAARILTGQLRAVYKISSAKERPEELPKTQEDDEPYHDPATRKAVLRQRLKKESSNAEGE